MRWIETDPESGAEIHQVTDEPRPSDNIYGEQPYSSADGTRITIRHYPQNNLEGGLSVFDLENETLHPVLNTMPRFPAFHAWSDYLYYQEKSGDRLLLKRCAYRTLEEETLIDLPTDIGNLSYGTASPDHSQYAVSVRRQDKSSFVLLIHLPGGRQELLVDSAERYFKHEQFALDGSNRVLIQANSQDVSTVYLGILQSGRESACWIAADRPHTPRPTGHEAWIGRTDRIFFSTGTDSDTDPNLWTAGVQDTTPQVACKTALRFGHVSASACGKYWIADATREAGIPIYAGSFATGRFCRLIDSQTQHDGKQWSHTHPYLTADNRWLVYTSTRSGLPQVHAARLPEGLLQTLDTA